MALAGIRVLEFSGLAPMPFCAMILADHGAKVLKIDNPKAFIQEYHFTRGKATTKLDVNNSTDVDTIRNLVVKSDVVLDPFRPGTLERKGLGGETMRQINNRLIVAQLSGYKALRSSVHNDKGSSDVTPSDAVLRLLSVLPNKGGHDINYLAISGVLSVLGKDNYLPEPPINLLADFAGGSFGCALKILLALYEREKTGEGALLQLDMTTLTTYLASFLWSSKSSPLASMLWPNSVIRGANLLDGGAPFYRCYKTKDNAFISVGALENKFYQNLMTALDLKCYLHKQNDMSSWPKLAADLSSAFLSLSRDEICRIAANTDCCVTPVLSSNEALCYYEEDFEQDRDTGVILPKCPGNVREVTKKCLDDNASRSWYLS